MPGAAEPVLPYHSEVLAAMTNDSTFDSCCSLRDHLISRFCSQAFNVFIRSENARAINRGLHNDNHTSKFDGSAGSVNDIFA